MTTGDKIGGDKMNDVLESLRIAIIAVTTLAIAAGFCILYAWAGVYIAVHYGELRFSVTLS